LGFEPHYSEDEVCSLQGKRSEGVLKKNASYLARIRKPWIVVVEDESIFIYETKIRKVWARKGTKPVILTTGSHDKTVWYGALANDGTQMFRQYPTGNCEYFLEYMEILRRKYPHMVLFIDRATYHKKDGRAKAYFRKHRKTIRIRWFPPAFPESNPLEECWRQGKDETLGSTFYQTFKEFKKATQQYYRTKRFKLDLYKYLCH
jgi:transposase